MKKLIAFCAFAGGLLLVLIPRYILPACEYVGYAHMHCGDTARAEFMAGSVLMAIGIATFFLERRLLLITSAVTAIIVYGVSFWLPDKIGYCMSSRMPCNYGMVPGIRFIDTIGALILIVAVINLVRTSQKKRIP